jgi:hypothetical protein
MKAEYSSSGFSVKALILLAGPLLTVTLLNHLCERGFILYDQKTPFTIIALLLWSPLFFSVPALLQQKERDTYMSSSVNFLDSVVRSFTLPLHLLINKRTRKLEFISYVGLLLGLLLLFIK